MSKILIVDDEKFDHAVLIRAMENEGHSTMSVYNCDDAFSAINSLKRFDAMLLDWNLHLGNGLDVLKHTKKKRPKLPIIMMSGVVKAADRALALEIGADDFVIKDNDVSELLVRLKRVLKSHDTGNKIRFDNEHKDAYDINGKPFGLSETDFKILKTMAYTKNHIISRDQIADIIRSDGIADYDKTIDIVIARIRKRLNCTPKSPKFIKTLRGKGYAFIGEIME